MFRARLIGFAVLVVALALPGAAWAQQPNFWDVTYFSNAHTAGAPDGRVRINNIPNVLPEPPAPLTPGDICAMIYVYNFDQQQAACCGCRVTPHGLLTLSINSLTSNPLTGVPPTRGQIMIVQSGPNAAPPATTGPPGSSPTCDPRIATTPPPNNLYSWASHVQDASVAPATGQAWSITDDLFKPAGVTGAVTADAQSTCLNNIRQGSGFGTCSCPGEAASGGGTTPDPT